MTQQLTNRQPATQRSGALDAVRILGIVAVVAGHVFEGAAVTKGLYTWHVPVFFFLTGYLWTADRSFRVELRKRTGTLILPYAAWLVLIGVPFLAALVLADKFDAADLVPLVLGGSYLGRPFSAFWFITALFAAALIFRLLQKAPVVVQWVFAVLCLATAASVGQILAEVPLSLGVAIPCVIFIAAGAMAKEHRRRITSPITTAVLLLGGSAALIVTGISAPLDLKSGDFGTPVVSILVAVAVSLGLVLVAEEVLPRMGTDSNAAATSMALGGLMVVLAHAFFIWVLGLVSLNQWLVFAIALIVPWAVALVVSKTPLSGILLGVPFAPRRTTA